MEVTDSMICFTSSKDIFFFTILTNYVQISKLRFSGDGVDLTGKEIKIVTINEITKYNTKLREFQKSELVS